MSRPATGEDGDADDTLAVRRRCGIGIGEAQAPELGLCNHSLGCGIENDCSNVGKLMLGIRCRRPGEAELSAGCPARSNSGVDKVQPRVFVRSQYSPIF